MVDSLFQHCLAKQNIKEAVISGGRKEVHLSVLLYLFLMLIKYLQCSGGQ